MLSADKRRQGVGLLVYLIQGLVIQEPHYHCRSERITGANSIDHIGGRRGSKTRLFRRDHQGAGRTQGQSNQLEIELSDNGADDFFVRASGADKFGHYR